ncbi:hypothetical protein NE237_002038 [Protea cynaroides]|uniref:Uncharacterized protein n=1 Tax=Protea cynaroides TaxID=273540 RepID=A0A9Q0QYY4_9MAGN|nr:hypothetical protein NE237_002038 [Protea cynaroides]
MWICRFSFIILIRLSLICHWDWRICPSPLWLLPHVTKTFNIFLLAVCPLTPTLLLFLILHLHLNLLVSTNCQASFLPVPDPTHPPSCIDPSILPAGPVPSVFSVTAPILNVVPDETSGAQTVSGDKCLTSTALPPPPTVHSNHVKPPAQSMSGSMFKASPSALSFCRAISFMQHVRGKDKSLFVKH